MCLSERDLSLLSTVLVIALAQVCFVFTTPEGRAARAGVPPRAIVRPLLRSLVFTLPAAGLIKLLHDWIGSDGRSVCVSRLVYLLGCFLLCAALEFQFLASKLVDTDPDDLDLATRYPVRRWGLIFLFIAVWIALLHYLSLM